MPSGHRNWGRVTDDPPPAPPPPPRGLPKSPALLQVEAITRAADAFADLCETLAAESRARRKER